MVGILFFRNEQGDWGNSKVTRASAGDPTEAAAF
jgi:hypothetical protein